MSTHTARPGNEPVRTGRPTDGDPVEVLSLDPGSQDAARRACALAERMLARSKELEKRRDQKLHERLGSMLEDESGKASMLVLIDEVLRIHDPARAARRLRELLAEQGAPSFLGTVDRAAFSVGARSATRAPKLVLPLVLERVRREAGGSILPAEDPAFGRLLRRRAAQGVRMNVNVLGEAVLGDEEAAHRVEQVLARVRRPDVDYISVKASAICAHLTSIAFETSVQRVAKPLRRIYREAMAARPAVFVNLDMEEYDDLELTTAVFMRVLSEPEFTGLDAGIVLQAYLPDSSAALLRLCEWARERRDGGGGSIKVRIVKGANLAMEAVEAEVAGWPQAPFGTKTEVDAHYKHMLDLALDERWSGAVRLGVASHNLFDIAWALTVAADRRMSERIEIEMLEGMAPAQAQAVKEEAGGLLLYAPIAARDDFESAIAYLVRRLDENTQPDNFLRSLFSLEPGSPTFEAERARFLQAVAARSELDTHPRRDQDRSRPQPAGDPDAAFVNEPDTDFSSAANRRWLADAIESYRSHPATVVEATVAGQELAEPLTGSGIDPNHPEREAYRYVRADRELVERAVGAARTAQQEWAARPMQERRSILNRVADVMAAHRGETIAVMMHDAGKVVGQADPEVSEAIDFARYYAAGTRTLETLLGQDLDFEPLGVVVVASPWNFPYAIPAGGVLASLAAGNSVILKPAPETVLTASLIARYCYEAGVPRDVLQFLPTPDDEVGQRLITHEDVGGVILTGAFETAELFTGWKPELRLHAETSGKNALVVTATADMDLAIADLVSSAFGHGGQKCSAASLGILEASVYDDPAFRRRLADAVTTLRVGVTTDLATDVGPLINPPSGPLADALTRLQPGEQWLVEPQQVGDNPHLWSPGVKLGVRPGSPFHLTECFGPVLGLMRAESLDQALNWQNAVAYGLTGGIHALDPAEIRHWSERVEVGNAYINRHTTGAVVQRQPFGGWKRSSVGPTVKAGGPNYVLSLGRWTDRGMVDVSHLHASLSRAWAQEFGVEHDPTGLAAERNLFRYRPLPAALLRVGELVPGEAVANALAAADRAGVAVQVSTPVHRDDLPATRLVVETDAALAGRLARSRAARIRVLGAVDPQLRTAAMAVGMPLDDSPVVSHGRVEGLRWLREQAVSITNHRHGTIMTA